MCSYTNIVASAILLWIILLQRAIEIWEIILDVIKKETPRFTGKIFISADQRYHKIVACLLASRLIFSFLSFVQLIKTFMYYVLLYMSTKPY